MDENEKTGPMIKPLHAALVGPVVGVSAAVGGMLIAPYVELHTAHHILLICGIIALIVLAPCGVVCFSKNREEWSDDVDWPS